MPGGALKLRDVRKLAETRAAFDLDLPLTDLPILGRLHGDASETQVDEVLTLVRQSHRGGCVQVCFGGQEASVVRRLGECYALLRACQHRCDAIMRLGMYHDAIRSLHLC